MGDEIVTVSYSMHCLGEGYIWVMDYRQHSIAGRRECRQFRSLPDEPSFDGWAMRLGIFLTTVEIGSARQGEASWFPPKNCGMVHSRTPDFTVELNLPVALEVFSQC
ncbi:uncharacterized protein G6M90_00g038600 [Metarhizium brunneum]|uniref:Uncharacterized protein n=1 Tax=Metarhizium brunneum TaxID=500148 RepID=A0A7D5YUY9_9HYPO|nr:hypothetical protein G6M90_00g038600 [Metarhizium brunneum]